MTKRVLAFDFGASSGRAIIGCFDGDKITLEEVHRFSNDPVSVGGTVYWDVLRLFYEIKQGIVKAKIAGVTQERQALLRSRSKQCRKKSFTALREYSLWS